MITMKENCANGQKRENPDKQLKGFQKRSHTKYRKQKTSLKKNGKVPVI